MYSPAYRLMALLAAIMLCSCSTAPSQTDLADPSNGSPAADDAGLPSVGSLDAMRGAAELVEDNKNGSEAAMQSPGAQVDATALDLVPAGGSFEWGIYSFATGGDTPVGVEFGLSMSAGSGAYVALADYTKARWSWFGPFDDSQTLSLATSNYVSPGGNFHCAVAAASGDGISVDNVKFVADNFEVGTPAVIGDDPEEDEENQESKLILVNGNPAVAYVDFASQNLMYIRATDALGTAWNDPQIINSFGSPGGDDSASPDMIVVNGNPAIAYFDGNFKLSYIRATDANGTAWGAPVNADAAEDSGDYPAMLMVDGRPAIAYYGFFNDSVRYVRASDANGTSWGTPVNAVTPLGMTDETLDCMSLVLVDGNPALAYANHVNNTLAYVRASDTLGAAWGTPVSLDGSPKSGYLANLRVLGGVPVAAYYHLNDGELRLVRAEDAQGTAWNDPQVLEDGMRGASLSMEIIGGIPTIVHHDLDDGTLLLMKAANAAGTSWGNSVVLDNNGEVGRYPSMTELAGGSAAVVYSNLDTGQLQFLVGF